MLQELMRVLFDRLGQSFLNAGLDNTLVPMYEGHMLDYIRCMECGNQRTRTDTFLDVQVCCVC